MQTQVYELMIYSVIHVFIYLILLALMSSSFGKRLWNSMFTYIIGNQVKYDVDDDAELNTFVETEKRLVKELNVQHARKYLT